MTIDIVVTIESEYLVPNEILLELKSRYPNLEINTKLVYIQQGLDYPINISFFSFPEINIDLPEFPVIFLNKEKQDEHLSPLLNNLSNSEDMDTKLGVVIFTKNFVSMMQLRSLTTDTEIKWLAFSIEDLKMGDFLLQTIKSTINYSFSDIWSLDELQHLPGNLKFLIQRVNQLFRHNFWDSILVILRKILENSIHIWWKRNNNNNDSDLRTDDGYPLPLLSRLEKIKRSSGIITPRDFSNIKTIKLIADFCAHSMEYRASKEEMNYALAQIKIIVSKLFS